MNTIQELFKRWMLCVDAANNSDSKELKMQIDNFNWLYKKSTYDIQGEFHHHVAEYMKEK